MRKPKTIIEWSCSDCGEFFITDERVHVDCPDCGSYKVAKVNQPEPDPQGEDNVTTSA